jgi:hypothetical protein
MSSAFTFTRRQCRTCSVNMSKIIWNSGIKYSMFMFQNSKYSVLRLPSLATIVCGQHAASTYPEDGGSKQFRNSEVSLFLLIKIREIAVSPDKRNILRP